MEPPVTIGVLCYGNHECLAERVLTSIHRNTRRQDFRLRLGLNAVGPTTRALIRRLLPKFDVDLLVRSKVNLYKEPMLRRLLHERPIRTEWFIWFDDDSFIFREDWLQMLQCESALNPQIDMWGKKCFVRCGEKHREFVRAAKWSRGLELDEDDRPNRWRISFALGGFWAIRTRWLYLLDWPDPRLIQYGADYMLGEALRQNGARIGNAFSGVAIDQAQRRIPSETPRCEVLH